MYNSHFIRALGIFKCMPSVGVLLCEKGILSGVSHTPEVLI
jgi:hypothetical protein